MIATLPEISGNRSARKFHEYPGTNTYKVIGLNNCIRVIRHRTWEDSNWLSKKTKKRYRAQVWPKVEVHYEMNINRVTYDKHIYIV